MSLDMKDEDNLLILEQEIAILDEDELTNLVKVSKKYRKTLGYFYERVLQEKRIRKHGVL